MCRSGWSEPEAAGGKLHYIRVRLYCSEDRTDFFPPRRPWATFGFWPHLPLDITPERSNYRKVQFPNQDLHVVQQLCRREQPTPLNLAPKDRRIRIIGSETWGIFLAKPGLTPRGLIQRFFLVNQEGSRGMIGRLQVLSLFKYWTIFNYAKHVLMQCLAESYRSDEKSDVASKGRKVNWTGGVCTRPSLAFASSPLWASSLASANALGVELTSPFVSHFPFVVAVFNVCLTYSKWQVDPKPETPATLSTPSMPLRPSWQPRK